MAALGLHAGSKPAHIATTCSAAVCTSLHLFLASLQLNSAVFLGSDPFTATSLPTPHIPHNTAFALSYFQRAHRHASVTAHVLFHRRVVALALHCLRDWWFEHAVA